MEVAAFAEEPEGFEDKLKEFKDQVENAEKKEKSLSKHEKALDNAIGRLENAIASLEKLEHGGTKSEGDVSGASLSGMAAQKLKEMMADLTKAREQVREAKQEVIQEVTGLADKISQEVPKLHSASEAVAAEEKNLSRLEGLDAVPGLDSTRQALQDQLEEHRKQIRNAIKELDKCQNRLKRVLEKLGGSRSGAASAG